MFLTAHVLAILVAMPLLNSTSVVNAKLTKADIPSDLPRDLRQLLEQTFSSDVRERANAAKKLGEMHERAAPAIPFLIRLQGDIGLIDAGSGYYYAKKALVAIGEPALEACIADAKGGQHDAIVCLGEFKCSRAVDVLLELLETPDSEIRRVTLIALRGCTDSRAAVPLIQILAGGNIELRTLATYCFRSLREPRSVEPLLEVLEERDLGEACLLRPTVEALGCQKDRRAVPLLLRILQNPKEKDWLRYSAARSLGQIGDPTVFPILVTILRDRKEPSPVRSGAARGIGVHGVGTGELLLNDWDHGRILTLLASVLNSNDEPLELRESAAQAMGEFGDREALKWLIPVADVYGHDRLGFWAAVSVVKLTDGAVREASVVRAIRNLRPIIEGDGGDLQEQHDSLEKIAEHGTSLRVRLAARDQDWLVIVIPVVLVVVVSCVAVEWAVRRKRYRALANRVDEGAEEKRGRSTFV